MTSDVLGARWNSDGNAEIFKKSDGTVVFTIAANGSTSKELIVKSIGPALLVNSTTYKLSIPVGRACTIKAIRISAAVRIASGTNTLAIKKNAAGPTLLGSATIDPVSIPTAVYKSEELTLTSTAADLVLDADDCILVTLVTGTQGTAGEGYSLAFELEYAAA